MTEYDTYSHSCKFSLMVMAICSFIAVGFAVTRFTVNDVNGGMFAVTSLSVLEITICAVTVIVGVFVFIMQMIYVTRGMKMAEFLAELNRKYGTEIVVRANNGVINPFIEIKEKELKVSVESSELLSLAKWLTEHTREVKDWEYQIPAGMYGATDNEAVYRVLWDFGMEKIEKWAAATAAESR